MTILADSVTSDVSPVPAPVSLDDTSVSLDSCYREYYRDLPCQQRQAISLFSPGRFMMQPQSPVITAASPLPTGSPPDVISTTPISIMPQALSYSSVSPLRTQLEGNNMGPQDENRRLPSHCPSSNESDSTHRMQVAIRIRPMLVSLPDGFGPRKSSPPLRRFSKSQGLAASDLLARCWTTTTNGAPAAAASNKVDSYAYSGIPDHPHVVVSPSSTTEDVSAFSIDGADGPNTGCHHNEQMIIYQTGVTRRATGRNLFSFDSIYEEHAETQAVYQHTVRPVVDAVFHGRHGSVFAYGPTGSGKTYTMQGNVDTGDIGVVHYVAQDLFAQIKTCTKGREYSLHVQYFEIYNENIRDLLAPQPRDQDDNASIPVREDILGNVHVQATEIPVRSVQDVVDVLDRGNRQRMCAQTLLNARSSRSHAVLRITLTSSTDRGQGRPTHRVSVLNLVDLAGSENSANAGITGGIRKREAGKINQSLLSLSRVIYALSLPPKKQPRHIGYRDSKLTRILQPHLSGNACLAVLCCVSVARLHLEETRNALKFAASAKRVQVRPVVNEAIDQERLLLNLQHELKATKDALARLQVQLDRKLTAAQAVSSGEDSTTTPETDRGPSLEESKDDTDASSEAVLGPVDEPEESESSLHFFLGHHNIPPPVAEIVVMAPESSMTDRWTVAAGVLRVDDQNVKVKVGGPATTINGEDLEEVRARNAVLSEKLMAVSSLVGTLYQDLAECQMRNETLRHEMEETEEKLAARHGQDLGHVEAARQLRRQIRLIQVAVYAILTMFLIGNKELCLVIVLFLVLTIEGVTNHESFAASHDDDKMEEASKEPGDETSHSGVISNMNVVTRQR